LYIYHLLLKPDRELQIDKDDIKIRQPEPPASTANFKFARSWLVQEGMRVYQGDRSSFATDKDMRDEDAVIFIDEHNKNLKNKLNQTAG